MAVISSEEGQMTFIERNVVLCLSFRYNGVKEIHGFGEIYNQRLSAMVFYFIAE